MSEKPVETGQLREVARRFEAIERALRQGTDLSYFTGAADMASATVKAFYQMAAGVPASELVIELPSGAKEEEQPAEDDTERARRLT